MRSMETVMAVSGFLAVGCASGDQAAPTTTTTTAPVTARTAAACNSLGWGISPGAFSGGAELPAQLCGVTSAPSGAPAVALWVPGANFGPVRRMIDDDQVPVPSGMEQDEAPANWAVTIVDDYDDATPRVALVVESLGAAGTGLSVHLDADRARRLRLALRNALAEIGEDPGR